MVARDDEHVLVSVEECHALYDRIELELAHHLANKHIKALHVALGRPVPYADHELLVIIAEGHARDVPLVHFVRLLRRLALEPVCDLDVDWQHRAPGAAVGGLDGELLLPLEAVLLK